MSVYARVEGGVVVELFTPPTNVPLASCFPSALTWVDVTAVSPAPQQGWTYDGAVFAAPPATPPAPPPTIIPPSAFIDRFSAAEQQAVMTASQSSWQINLWLTKAVAATSVDVTDARTIAGMGALVTAGILTSARCAQILNLTIASP